MTLSLPIPGKKDKFGFYFINYDLSNPDYQNIRGELFLRDSETIHTFR